MRKLVYSTSLSLDGYIDSAAGDPSWVVPDEELHRHFNDVERETDTLLYGRRMYDIMAGYWPTADQDPSAPAVIVEYARLWKPVPKVVFSSTLESVDWNARLIKGDAITEVARLKAQPGNGSLGVGGLVLASALAAAGLIDEYRLYYVPIFLGSGKAAFSQIQNTVRLKPLETCYILVGDGPSEMRSRHVVVCISGLPWTSTAAHPSKGQRWSNELPAVMGLNGLIVR